MSDGGYDDPMGTRVGAASSKSRGKAKDEEPEDYDWEAFTETARDTMGAATLINQDQFSKTVRKVFAVFEKAGASDKKEVKKAIAYYHMANGSSPDQPWSSMTNNVVVEGVQVKPGLYVSIIIADGMPLRAFLRQFIGAITVSIAKTKVGRELLAERAARAGLDASQVPLINDLAPGADDYVTVGMRYMAKSRAVGNKESGGANLQKRRAAQIAEQGSDNMNVKSDGGGSGGDGFLL